MQVINILSNPANPNKRCVIVDGCNGSHGNHQYFSIEGMKICLDLFESQGHSTLAVVPQNKIGRNSNPSMLQELCNEKRVLFAPFDNEFGTCLDTYDDKCILGLAVRYDGAVVSNDNYRDLIDSSFDWREVIENRVIPFCFFKDMFIMPRDPYGPGRPSIQDILTRNRNSASG